VYGDGPFSDWSTTESIAVYLGLLKPYEKGVVLITKVAPQKKFPSAPYQNNINSYSREDSEPQVAFNMEADLRWQWYKPVSTKDDGSENNGPGARSKHTAIALGSSMYVFGGKDREKMCESDLWALDTVMMKWKKMDCAGEKPAKRWQHSACVVDDNMLLYGGYTGNDELLDDLWKLEQSVWRRVTLPAQGPCPGPRAMHSSLVYDGCMVVLGGTGLVSGCKEEAKGLYKLITTGLGYTWECVMQLPACSGPGSGCTWGRHHRVGGLTDDGSHDSGRQGAHVQAEPAGPGPAHQCPHDGTVDAGTHPVEPHAAAAGVLTAVHCRPQSVAVPHAHAGQSR
jgi:hypothetical protein